jgi:hypothetical protein
MRVQATETTPSYSMGKSKKHKIRQTKEASDSSDDGSGMYYRGKSKKHKIRKTKEALDSSDDGSGMYYRGTFKN